MFSIFQLVYINLYIKSQVIDLIGVLVLNKTYRIKHANMGTTSRSFLTLIKHFSIFLKVYSGKSVHRVVSLYLHRNL